MFTLHTCHRLYTCYQTLVNVSQNVVSVSPTVDFWLQKSPSRCNSVLCVVVSFYFVWGESSLRPWTGRASTFSPSPTMQIPSLISFLHHLNFSFLLFDSCAPDSPCLFLPLLLSFPLSSFPLPLAASLLCHSQESSWRWLGEPGSLDLDGPGTRQGLWSLGSPID